MRVLVTERMAFLGKGGEEHCTKAVGSAVSVP